MVHFQKTISENYTWEQIKLFGETAKNIQAYSAYLGSYSGPICLPLLNANPNIILKTFCRKEYRLSETDASLERLQRLCIEHYTLKENEYVIAFVCLTKGLTFINNYLNNNNEYTYLDRISLYLQQSPTHKIRAYKRGRKIIITTNSTDDAVDSAVLSALPLFFKEEFTWEQKIIRYFQLMNQNNQEALSEMKEIFDSFTKIILENQKRKDLEQALVNAANYQKKRAETDLQATQNRIKDYEQALIELYSKEKHQQAQVTFFKPSLNIEEVTEYVLNNKYIIDYFAYTDRYLVVAVEAPLEYIDVPALKKMLTNVNSYLYPKSNGARMPDSVMNNELEFIQFIKDLFITGKYRIYTRSEVVLDFDTKQAFPLRRANSYSSNSISRVRPTSWTLSNRWFYSKNRCITPHMHIEYYDCWAGNKTNIAKALNKNDIIGALDIIVNTTKDINVNDGAVFGRFIREGLYNPNEFRHQGNTNDSEIINFLNPGDQFKTIWDEEKQCFRTFNDIFQNEYLKNKTKTVEIQGEEQ